MRLCSTTAQPRTGRSSSSDERPEHAREQGGDSDSIWCGVWSATRVRWTPASVPVETVSYRNRNREVALGPSGTLKYIPISRRSRVVGTPPGWSTRMTDGGNPALDQDSALAASDGAWAPPVTKVPYVARWTSTHAPSDAAAAKWQALAQQRKFTEVHMPASCFVPMEAVHRAEESDRVTLFVGSHNLTRASQANHECVVQLGTERREYRCLPGVVHSLVGRLVPYSD